MCVSPAVIAPPVACACRIPTNGLSGMSGLIREMKRHAHQSADVWTVCMITSAGLQRVINTLSRLSSHNTFVLWVQSSLFVAWVQHQFPLQSRRRLRLQLRLWPQLLVPAPQMSNSECSSLEEQMPAKLRFCKESATRQRAQSSTGLVRRVLKVRYVLIPNGAFNPIIVYPG